MNTVPLQEDKIIIHIPIRLKQWGGRKVIVGPKGQDLRTLELGLRRDEKLLKALGRAYKWHKMIVTRKSANIDKIAEIESVHRSYIHRILQLMLLSPQVIEAILDGQQPSGFALKSLEKGFSPLWEEQAKTFGFTIHQTFIS